MNCTTPNLETTKEKRLPVGKPLIEQIAKEFSESL
jgi:hypothetical protein